MTTEINNQNTIINIIGKEEPAKRLHSSSSHASSGVHSAHTEDKSLKSSDTDHQVKEQQSLPDGYAEDRFRVDRKRLESLLSQSVKMNNNNTNQTNMTRAESFFMEVMNSTNTQVSWPSRLKVGAKSKKDPHIKITGPCEQVKVAKDKIMQQLDSKSSRVTIKMDVSHTDHSHVIGKGGSNIKNVMKETECHIHFPDSNRNSQVSEKSNQVSIAGQGSGVEIARQRIRELLPITLFFEYPTKHINNLDLNSSTIQNIVQTYNISVQIKSRKQFTSIIQVRGCVSNQIGLKDGVICLMQVLTGQLGQTIPITTSIEIQNVQSFMNAKSVAKIKAIQANTGITIDLPNDRSKSTNIFDNNDKIVSMTGAMEGVLYARQEIISQLPLVLMFDLKENIDTQSAQSIGEKFECFISIKSKAKQATKSCIIKSSEANVYNMFKARQILMNLSYNGLEDIPMPVNTASFLFNQKMTQMQMAQVTAQVAAQKQVVQQPIQQQNNNNFMPIFNKSPRRSMQISTKSINSHMISSTPSRDSANSSTKSIDSNPSTVSSGNGKLTQNESGILRQPNGPTEKGFVVRTMSGNQKTGIKIASIQNRQGSCSSKDDCISSGNECNTSDLSDSEHSNITSNKPVVSESYYKPISFRTTINKMKNIKGNVSSSTSDNSDEQIASNNKKIIFQSNTQTLKSKLANKQNNKNLPSSLSELFKNLNLEKYIQNFTEQEVDLATFQTMTDNDLRELGVNTFGARRKMSMAIKELNSNRCHTSTANISLRVGGK
jgi:protein bicaudal C